MGSPLLLPFSDKHTFLPVPKGLDASQKQREVKEQQTEKSFPRLSVQTYK